MSTTSKAPGEGRASPTPSALPRDTPAPGGDILLVAGMHRSGTSALARVLNLLGAEIPGPVVPAFDGNDLGHWEPQEVVELHDEMLRSARTNVNSLFPVPERWFEGEAARGFVDRLRRLMAGHLAQGRLHVVKDPRTALFLPVWRRALADLGVRPLVVLPFRDPLEVAASLQTRQMRAYPDAVWPLGRGVLLWLRYVLQAEAASRGLARSFVSFDALLDDWRGQVARIGEQLGVAWPRDDADAVIEASLRREHKHAQRADADGFALADDVLTLLGNATERADEQAAAFDAARAALDDACGMFNDYVEALELRLGEVPTLRSEYVDFLGQREQPSAVGPETPDALEAAMAEPDAERRNGLLTVARIRQSALAARCVELGVVNEALLGAARRLEHLHRADIRDAADAVHAAEREGARWRSQAEEAVSERDEARTALTQAARAQADAAAFERERAESESEFRAVVERIAVVRAQAAAANVQLATAASGRDLALRRLAEVEEAEAALRASTSWRVTAPLRAVVTRLRRR